MNPNKIPKGDIIIVLVTAAALVIAGLVKMWGGL